jgi:hypothetical protein
MDSDSNNSPPRPHDYYSRKAWIYLISWFAAGVLFDFVNWLQNPEDRKVGLMTFVFGFVGVSFFFGWQLIGTFKRS